MKAATKKKLKSGLAGAFGWVACMGLFGGGYYALTGVEDYQKAYPSLSYEDAKSMRNYEAVETGFFGGTLASLLIAGAGASASRRKEKKSQTLAP